MELFRIGLRIKVAVPTHNLIIVQPKKVFQQRVNMGIDYLLVVMTVGGELAWLYNLYFHVQIIADIGLRNNHYIVDGTLGTRPFAAVQSIKNRVIPVGHIIALLHIAFIRAQVLTIKNNLAVSRSRARVVMHDGVVIIEA